MTTNIIPKDQQKTKTGLQSALEYARLGWAVFPVHYPILDGAGNVTCSCGNDNCHSIGKHPLGKWREESNRIEKTIKRHWNDNRSFNVGIDTGKSGLVVLDIDKKSGGLESLQELEKDNELLPETVIASTGGGGVHYYFKMPEDVEIRNSASQVAPGIDVRGMGGFVVAPPSLHASGNSYEWINEPGLYEPAEIPGWLLQKMIEPARNKELSEGWEPGISEGAQIMREQDTIPEGQRNSALFHMGCKMREYGLTERELLSTLWAINQQRCTPPVSQNEVEQLVKNISNRYRQGEGIHNALSEADRVNMMDCIEKLDKDAFDEPEMIGGLCPRNYITILFSPPGGGKSFLTQKLAMDLSRGGTILDGFHESEPRKVLIFAGEAGSRLLNIRAKKAIHWTWNDENLNIISENRLSKSSVISSLSSFEGRENFTTTIERTTPDLVIFDTLFSFHDSDENKMEQMKPIMEYLTHLAEDMNMAILVNHHSRKYLTAKEEYTIWMDDCQGSNIIARSAGHMLAIDKKKPDGEDLFTVKTVKSWFKFIKKFNFSIDNNHLVIDLNPDPGGTTEDLVLSTLQETFGYGNNFKMEKAQEACLLRHSINKRTARDKIGKLVNKGKIRKKGENKGAHYFLTQL